MPLFSNGIGRTGVFITLHAQLERLKIEGVIDVFQFIKFAREQREGLVSTPVSCYNNNIIMLFKLSRRVFFLPPLPPPPTTFISYVYYTSYLKSNNLIG